MTASGSDEVIDYVQQIALADLNSIRHIRQLAKFPILPGRLIFETLRPVDCLPEKIFPVILQPLVTNVDIRGGPPSFIAAARRRKLPYSFPQEARDLTGMHMAVVNSADFLSWRDDGFY